MSHSAMSHSSWQLDLPLDAVIFDCDGTLSQIEGIDELAELNQVGGIVQRLTQDAMTRTGMNVDLFEKRLALTQPTKKQIEFLGELYYQKRTPPILEIIQTLQRLHKKIYIVSGGFLPAIKIFASLLNIAHENVFAVDLSFDAKGNYQDFDRTSPLIHKEGKRFIVEHIKQHNPRTAFIGDGLSDLEVKDLVTRFVGYGGVYFRQNIADATEFYIPEQNISGLLPLVLTAEESLEL